MHASPAPVSDAPTDTPTPAHAADPSEHPRQSASARVLGEIRSLILFGSLPGGTLVTEGELAERTGVSRTPVREALLRLEAEGLVQLYPKKGALIVPISAQQTREVLGARTLLEEWAAAHMWSSRAEVLPRLRESMAALREAARAHDVPRFAQTDRDFHETIVAAAGNGIVTQWYHALRDRQLCILATGARMSDRRMTDAVRDHAELLGLLESGRKAEFLRATAAHVALARTTFGGDR